MQNDVPVQEYFRREVLFTHEVLKKRKVTEDITHDLRVSLRRMRVVLKILSDADLYTLSKKNRKALDNLWESISRMRDSDVSSLVGKKYLLKENKLKKIQKKSKDELKKTLKGQDVAALVKTLKKVSSKKFLLHVDPRPTAVKLACKINKVKVDNEHLHQIRIILKKVRYFLEVLNMEDMRFKKYQDVLGEYNDLQVFIENYGSNSSLEKDHLMMLKEAKKHVDLSLSLAKRKLKTVVQ